MDLLQECATNYTKLLTSRYHIICGRSKAGQKERLAFDITFWQSDFYHLAGLHKLSDLPPFRRLRKPDTIAKILDGQLTESLARKSDYFSQIEDRLILLANLEPFLDSNDLVFRYDKKYAPGTTIEANYLLQNLFQQRIAYLFLAQRHEDNTQVCKSFFYKKNIDYTKGQQKFALLYKEKTNLTTGTTVVQYDKL